MKPGWVKHFAPVLGVDRTCRYRAPTRRMVKDAQAITILRTAHSRHPAYGYRRLSLALGWNDERTRRLMRKAGIVVGPRKRRWRPAGESVLPVPDNALKRFADHTTSNAWAQDFTYLPFQGLWLYLAVVLDLKTRQVVGWQLGTRHRSELTFTALFDALRKYPPPAILHSDQGSEYLSEQHRLLCERLAITLSCSDKGSPWQNGFMESFFGRFKEELGPLTQLGDLAQLHEGIALRIHYYNTTRIHTSLQMSPAAYAAQLTQQAVSENVLQKVGA